VGSTDTPETGTQDKSTDSISISGTIKLPKSTQPEAPPPNPGEWCTSSERWLACSSNKKKGNKNSQESQVTSPETRLTLWSTESDSSYLGAFASNAVAPSGEPGVMVLLADTDRVATSIDQRIYGQFLEHINHSVEEGLFAEQICGAGFEGEDFKTYWESFADRGQVGIANVDFRNGTKSVRPRVEGGRVTIRQGRIFLDAGVKYDGSLWLKRETGSPKLTLQVKTSRT
jgi:hypothetical protein